MVAFQPASKHRRRVHDATHFIQQSGSRIPHRHLPGIELTPSHRRVLVAPLDQPYVTCIGYVGRLAYFELPQDIEASSGQPGDSVCFTVLLARYPLFLQVGIENFILRRFT